MSQQLRQQQEEEYMASLHVDQERERAIQEAQRQQNEAKLAAERDEEEKTLRRQQIQSRRIETRAALPLEPSPGEPNSVKVSLKFPSGERVERRFHSDDSLQVILQ